MLLPVLAIVLALPQVAGYLLTRVWRRAGQAEWMGAAVATYTAIWYATCHRMTVPPPQDGMYHCGLGPMISWGLLFAGLMLELLLGILLAGIAFQLRRSREAAPPPAPPAP
jgi:hypothetical protein